MSISKNVGAMNKYLTKLISGKMYSTMKNKSLGFLEKMPRMHNFAKFASNSLMPEPVHIAGVMAIKSLLLLAVLINQRPKT
jgi:deoxyxylulose-5-phosphate synthase